MQKSISKAAIIWRLILSGFIVTSLISCEDTNTVGGGVVEPVYINIDTINVSGFQNLNSNIYSGKIQSLPIGRYDDPLFGSFTNIGYLKPSLGPGRNGSLTSSSKLYLKLILNNSINFGDTTQTANFSIYRTLERWRGNAILSDDNVAYDESDLVGSFSYQNEDSLFISLSDSLLADYAYYVNLDDSTINRDSLYNYEFFGITIVPEDVSSQYIYTNIIRSEFVTVRSSIEDTVDIKVQDYAFTLDRDNLPGAFTERLYLNNYLENFYSISFEDVAATIGSKNILKAELKLYEDTAQLENSLPANHARPLANFIDLKFASLNELRYDIQFTATDFAGIRNTTDNSFTFNITNHINNYLFGSPEEKTLYLNINPNGGIFNSSLLYDSSSADSLKPKLILTIEE